MASSQYDQQMSVTDSQASSVGDYDTDEDDDVMDYYSHEELSEPQDSQTFDPERYEYTCVPSKEAWSILETQINQLSELLSVPYYVAHAILHHLQWETEQAIEKHRQDPTSLYRSAHLPPPSISTSGGSLNRSYSQGPVDACQVCLDEPKERLLMPSCGHGCCSPCWLQHVLTNLEMGVAMSIECMYCEVLLGRHMVVSILNGSPSSYAKYEHLLLTETVGRHSLFRWCPGRDCNMVFQVKESQPKRVVCSQCKSECCFKCGEQYHSPTDCDTIKLWLVKCKDDSETVNYIAGNTKDCPKCHAAIEKSGGCNHMQCSRCKHNWSKHSREYYECSRFQSNPKIATEKSASARVALEKYLFYYHRWNNHHHSLLLEEQTRRGIMNHIEDKVAGGEGTWIDWQYLLDAANLLRNCRYTLKYTYPYAYYMTGGKKQLFEYQQAQLELEIENLSWKVERAEQTDVADLKQQMNVAEIRRVTLFRDFLAA